MSKDRIGPDENLRPPRLRIPPYGWVVLGFITLILAVFAFYRTHATYEHLAEDKYLGPGRCKACHPRQYESWAKTKMAHSFSLLRPGAKAQEKRSVRLDPLADYTHDASCLPCHTTGLGRPGGFVSIETTPDLAGVTCESCHGPGGSYAELVMGASNPRFSTADARKSGLTYPPTEVTCLACHNSKSPFAGTEGWFDPSQRVNQGGHEHFHGDYDHGR